MNRKETAEYVQRSERRMTKLKRFLHSEVFTETTLKACISALPRWRYMRELERRPKDDGDAEDADSDSDEEFTYVSVPKKARGIARAQAGFLDASRRILKARDPLVEMLINREKSETSLRLMIWRALAASAAYLSLKNMPYVSPEWLEICVR